MEKSFFKDFEPLSVADQLAKIHHDLGGENGYNDLIWNAPEGIEIHPIYPVKETELKRSAPKEAPTWKITQCLSFVKEKEVFLERVQNALNHGVEALYLELCSPCDFIQTLLSLLKNEVGIVFFVFRYFPKAEDIELLQALEGVVVCYDFQAEGLSQGGWPETYAISKQQWWSLFKQNKTVNLFVNASIFANAGADISQQLTFTLLHLNEYLNTLFQNKQKAPVNVLVQWAFGSNYFFEIAKSHAFRILAENLFKPYDFKVNLSLLGEPLQRNKCTMDYNVNILRTTTEMMSAVLGEMDFVMNHPYDLRFNPPNDFSDRIARNQLLLLKHESGFDQHLSPVEGTHYITALIEELSAQSWTHFLAEEANGGWEKVVQNNHLQESIFAAEKTEKARLRSGEQVLVGATKYQDSTTLNAVKKTREPVHQFADFKSLTIQYLQE